MYNGLAMGIVQAGTQLFKYIQYLVGSEACLLFKYLAERGTLDKSRHKIKITRLFTDIVSWEDVRVGKPGQYRSFPGNAGG